MQLSGTPQWGGTWSRFRSARARPLACWHVARCTAGSRAVIKIIH